MFLIPLFNDQLRFRIDHVVPDIGFQDHVPRHQLRHQFQLDIGPLYSDRFDDLFTVFTKVFCYGVQVGNGYGVFAAFGSAWVAFFESGVFLCHVVT